MSRLLVPVISRIYCGSVPASRTASISLTSRADRSSVCSPAIPRLITGMSGSRLSQSPHSISESPSMSRVFAVFVVCAICVVMLCCRLISARLRSVNGNRKNVKIVPLGGSGCIARRFSLIFRKVFQKEFSLKNYRTTA